MREREEHKDDLIATLQSNEEKSEKIIKNLTKRTTEIEEKNRKILKEMRNITETNTVYERQFSGMNATLSTILVYLHKIKSEHVSMKQEFSRMKTENEFLTEKNGLDLAQLTPRPNWEELKYTYGVDEIDTGKKCSIFMNQLKKIIWISY